MGTFHDQFDFIHGSEISLNFHFKKSTHHLPCELALNSSNLKVRSTRKLTQVGQPITIRVAKITDDPIGRFPQSIADTIRPTRSSMDLCTRPPVERIAVIWICRRSNQHQRISITISRAWPGIHVCIGEISDHSRRGTCQNHLLTPVPQLTRGKDTAYFHAGIPLGKSRGIRNKNQPLSDSEQGVFCK